MTRFIKNLFLFLVLFIIIVTLSVLPGSYFLKRNNYHEVPLDKEYVILGNSHPECAFNDSLINHFYNFSKSGEPYFYSLIKVRELLKNNTHIKGIFLEYTLEDITEKRDEWTWNKDHLQNNYPKYIYAMQPEDFTALLRHNPEGFLSVHFFQSFVRQMSLLIIVGEKKLKSYYGGYYRLDRNKLPAQVKADSLNRLNRKNIISNFQVKKLRQLIEFLNLNGIKVYLISTPLHKSVLRGEDSRTLMSMLGSKYQNIDYLDFRNYLVTDEKYGDPAHLNYQGAKEFSLFFNKLIEDDLLNKHDKELFVQERIEKENRDRGFNALQRVK